MPYKLAINMVLALVFLFILWRRLKEDYSQGIVFSTGFLILSGVALGSLISAIFFREWWFWLSLLGIVLGGGFAIFKFKLRGFEVFDATVVAILPWLLVVFLSDSVEAKSIYSLGGFFVILAVYLLYHFLNTSYKKFSWYRSGRVGFSGLATVAILFLLRGLTGLFLVDMLSFVGKIDSIISGVLAFLAFLGIFHLARQK